MTFQKWIYAFTLLLSSQFIGLVTAPPPFRPGNPALCGSHPLVTPCYCRLGDLLCFVFISAYCVFDLSVYYLLLQYFDTVGWVFLTCKNRLPYNLYCVRGDVKHFYCSIQSNTRSSNIGCSRFAFICYSLPLHLHSPFISQRQFSGGLKPTCFSRLVYML